MSISQEKVLKDRIRELEQSKDRSGQVGGDYLKHVVMKYMEYNQKGDMKAQALVPALCTLLSLSAEERHAVEQASIPTPLLYLNQAVGSLFSGGEGQAQEATPPTAAPSIQPAASEGLDPPSDGNA